MPQLHVIVDRLPTVPGGTGGAGGLPDPGMTSIIGRFVAAETSVPCPILSGQTTSNSIEVRDFSRFTLYIPPELDGTTMAIQVSYNDTVWFDLYDIFGQQVVVGGPLNVIAANRAYDLPGEIAPSAYIRFVCGTVQSGDTNLVLGMKHP